MYLLFLTGRSGLEELKRSASYDTTGLTKMSHVFTQFTAMVAAHTDSINADIKYGQQDGYLLSLQQAWTGPGSSRRLRLPDFETNSI